MKHLDNRQLIDVIWIFLCILGIQKRKRNEKSSASTFVSMPNEVGTDLLLFSTSDIDTSVELYLGFPESELLVGIRSSARMT